METLRIVLVDDHEIVLDGIASLLKEEKWLDVVGKCNSVAQAKTMVEKTRPDLVLTDISMGEHSAKELVTFLTDHHPLVRVMVLTMHEELPYITDMLQAGAQAYLLKNVQQPELLQAIKEVMAGKTYIQQSLAPVYARTLRQRGEAEKQSQLSPREIEILRLVVEERTTAEISRQLFLSETTVSTHRRNIARKTGAKSPVGLLHFARQHGLI